MVYVQHQLNEEFPEAGERIDQLCKLNCGFTQVAAEYERVNREIYLIESRMHLAGDEELSGLRSQREALKQRLMRCLNSDTVGKC
jgi:uncharacterized protein